LAVPITFLFVPLGPSIPMVTHESTAVHGRGTEEVKTNDVSHRIKKGEVGLVVEFGRPGNPVSFNHVR